MKKIRVFIDEKIEVGLINGHRFTGVVDEHEDDDVLAIIVLNSGRVLFEKKNIVWIAYKDC